MTDWLDEILDRDIPESAPVDFVARVVSGTQREEGVAEIRAGRLLGFTQMIGMAAAAIALVSIGFWMGHGARPMQPSPSIGQGVEMAQLNIDELYQNRELLEAFELLSDEALDQAFLDAESGTWVLDIEVEQQK